MIYLYGNPRSSSLMILGQTLVNVFDVQVNVGRELDRVGQNPLIVCWGYSCHTGLPTLNEGGPKGDKWRELNLLRAGGISMPNFTMGHRPQGWYARLKHHHSANDLKQNLTRGDYYVEPMGCAYEYRIHVFKGNVKIGLKVPGDGSYHPIFRTHSCGWVFRYKNVDASPNTVQEAKKAVLAVGYDFGAVDIGVKRDGSPVVFEVNSAPTLAPGMALWYAGQLWNYYKELYYV